MFCKLAHTTRTAACYLARSKFAPCATEYATSKNTENDLKPADGNSVVQKTPMGFAMTARSIPASVLRSRGLRFLLSFCLVALMLTLVFVKWPLAFLRDSSAQPMTVDFLETEIASMEQEISVLERSLRKEGELLQNTVRLQEKFRTASHAQGYLPYRDLLRKMKRPDIQ